MRTFGDRPELEEVGHAVRSAFEVVRDFSRSEVGRELTPRQLLAVVAIAAVEQANRLGLPGKSAAATLRDLAGGVEDL